MAFRDPLFAFVGEEKRLPLEVVLADDSTPLADSDRILRALSLAVTSTPVELTPTVTLEEASDSGASPGRDLLFDVAAAQNDVRFDVVVVEQSELVAVAPLSFAAHFLSLEHGDEVEFSEVEEEGFVPDFELVEIALRGEAAGVEAETWTLTVANAKALEINGYEVAEVVFVSPETRIYSMVRKEVSMEGTPTWSVQTLTFNVIAGVEVEEDVTGLVAAVAGELPVGALAKFEEDAALRTLTLRVGGAAVVYSSEDLPEDAVTRTLRITRKSAGTQNSRVSLKFAYTPPEGEGAAGEFARTIELKTGVAAELRVVVRPETLVIPRGGMANVTLVISNLALGDDPSEFIDLVHSTDLQITRQDGELDVTNRLFEQVLQVRALPSGDEPRYEVQVEVRLPGMPVARARFSVDINDPPRYEGEELLMVLESGETQTREYLLKIVDPDGGLGLLVPSDLMLEVVSFESDTQVQDLSHTNDYFDLAAGDVLSDENPDADPNGNGNSLAVTLTLTGRLATPYGSVVELRLFGVGDGHDKLNQRLVVRVEDVAPTFELETTTIALFPDQEVVSVPVTMFSDGSADGRATGLRILVLEAPDDLVVMFDSAAGALGAITLRRLNDSKNEDAVVKLVVLDAQGGRKDVTIEVERPSLLPQIVPPQPLFIAAGDEMQTRQVRLVADTELEVTWTAVSDAEPDEIVKVQVSPLPGGHAELSMTASVDAAVGAALNLILTATADNGMVQEALLPVVVVAAEPRPRLQLSLSVADPEDSNKRVTVSSLLLTETLFVGATLAGAVSEDLYPLTFTISITKIGADGAATGAPLNLMAISTFSVEPFSLEVPVTLTLLTEATGPLMNGELVEVSIAAAAASGIAGDRLRLRVVDPMIVELSTVTDRDNDGLVDGFDDEAAPASALGPLTVALVRVTDSGVEVQQQEVRLSLGDLARTLGLGQCRGGVSLTLTLSDGDPVLHGCGDTDLYAALDDESRAAVLAAVVSLNDEAGEYYLLDLSATFDSSEAEPGDPLVINLPFDPRTHRVYRYDGENWVPVFDIGPSGQDSGSPGGAGALKGADEDCQSCVYAFYAADPDRDGSVALLLLVQPVEPELSFAVRTSDAVVIERVLEVTANAPLTLALTGLEEAGTLTVTINQVGVEDENANVEGSFVQTEAGPAVELRGLKRTSNGPEEVQVLVMNSEGDTVIATFYVTVPNQPPVIKFMLDGEETSSIELQTGVGATLEVVLKDPDGDTGLRLLELPERVDGVELRSTLVRTLVEGVAVDLIKNMLFLTSDEVRAPFKLSLKVSDDEDTGTGVLTVCYFEGKNGECPVAAGGGSGGGGGGGSTGLLWLFLLAPAVLARLRQRPHASTSLLA